MTKNTNKSILNRLIDRIPKTTEDIYLFVLAFLLVAIFVYTKQYDIAKVLSGNVIGGIMLYVKGKDGKNNENIS